MSETKYCARHPDTETNLSCGRCEEPVCPRCMVHGPVGVRCESCAQVKRVPTFDVTGAYLARAIGVGLALGIGGGLGFSFLKLVFGWGPFLDLLAVLGLGYLIGEGISAAVNRKRGCSLKFVAAGSMLVASSIISIFSIAFLSLFGSLLGLLALAGAFYIAINRF